MRPQALTDWWFSFILPEFGFYFFLYLICTSQHVMAHVIQEQPWHGLLLCVCVYGWTIGLSSLPSVYALVSLHVSQFKSNEQLFGFIDVTALKQHTSHSILSPKYPLFFVCKRFIWSSYFCDFPIVRTNFTRISQQWLCSKGLDWPRPKSSELDQNFNYRQLWCQKPYYLGVTVKFVRSIWHFGRLVKDAKSSEFQKNTRW